MLKLSFPLNPRFLVWELKSAQLNYTALTSSLVKTWKTHYKLHKFLFFQSTSADLPIEKQI